MHSVLPHLDSGEALLGAVFHRTPAALGQVSGSVLRLRLDEDLQLLSLTFLWVLATQYPTFLTRCLVSLGTRKQTVCHYSMWLQGHGYPVTKTKVRWHHETRLNLHSGMV